MSLPLASSVEVKEGSIFLWCCGESLTTLSLPTSNPGTHSFSFTVSLETIKINHIMVCSRWFTSIAAKKHIKLSLISQTGRDHKICEIPALIHISPLLNSWTFLLCLELSHSKYKPLIFNLFPYLSALTETRFPPEDTCFLAALSGGGCLLLKLPHTAQPEEKELSLFSTLPLQDYSPCFTLLECITWGASLHHLQWSHFLNLTAGSLSVSSMLPLPNFSVISMYTYLILPKYRSLSFLNSSVRVSTHTLPPMVIILHLALLPKMQWLYISILRIVLFIDHLLFFH